MNDSMKMAYANLSRAQLTYEYLHTNSTTHEFLFGALAELVDNARDAGATEISIYTIPKEDYRGGFLLSFLDNGCGMDPVEVSQVVQFGRSSKRAAGANHIGQYGNGLKSGSMRIGKDMILFTKKGETMSCLFLSRTFHEKEDIHEVIVPMPSWNNKTKKPHIPDGQSIDKHNIEVDIICKYSPFETEEELFKEFEKINSEAGTNVMIFNMKLMDNGLPELDTVKNPKDIIMADPHSTETYDIDENVQPEMVSFRAYSSILYCEPKMKIYIQNEKVFTKKLVYSLYKPRSYVFTSNRFKKRSELEADAAERAAKLAEEKAKELTTQAREANSKHNSTTKEDRQAIQLAVNKADEAKFDFDVKKRIAEAKRKSAKEPKTLTFTFGFNINKRRCDGIFIFNCNRLIRMYEKVGSQLEEGTKCAGLIGIVDVPYLVLEPTHNKQHFADQKEYKHLLKSMSDHMLQYWKDSKVESQGITKFWDDFGYTGAWKDDPSNDVKFKMKRLMSTPQLVQCNDCLKWRQLTFSRKMANYVIPCNWVCSNNTDIALSNCSKPEQKLIIQTGKLQKEIKNLDEKRAEEVRKLQEKLDNKKTEIKKKQKERSPSPEEEPPLPPVKRGRKAKSPSPTPPPRRGRKAKSPSPTPPLKRGRRAKSPSPSPPPTKQKKATPSKRKQKTPSPPPTPTRQRRRVSSPPPQKKTKSPSPPPPTSRAKKTAVEATSKSASKSKQSKNEESPVKTKKTTVPAVEQNEGRGSAEEEIESVYPKHCKVEALMHNKWYNGIVVAYKKSGENATVRVRVKFDKLSQDKYDKWFYETDSTLRVAQSDSNHVNNTDDDSAAVNNSTFNKEDYNDPSGELLEKVTYLLRRCLCYFRAPDFEKDKKEILALTPQQLKEFPMSMFFDDYERNIKKQLQATRDNLSKKSEQMERKIRELETQKNRIEKEAKELKQANTKSSKTLKDLRLDVNVMLRNILNEDEKLDLKDATDSVDIYLRTIVEQINEEAGKSS